VANWAMYRPDDGAFSIENFKADLCTTAIYHFAGLDERGALKSLDPWADLEDNYGKNGFKRFTGMKKLYPNLRRTLLAVGGWSEGSKKFSKLSALSFKRKSFARQSADFLKRYGFDGLNVFWDWPGIKFNFITMLIVKFYFFLTL
jgi:chitinase